MVAKWVPEDPDDIVRRYEAGESVLSLSKLLKIDRAPITRLLASRGITLRSHVEASRAWNARKTKEEREANAASAHRAATGRKPSFEERCKVAITKQHRLSHMHASEKEFADQLSASGVHNVVLQQAIGIYNVDLGVAPVAIEIFGGGWHAYGRHRRRTETRYRYLLDNGWAVLVIWCLKGFSDISSDAVAYAANYIAAVKADPALLGEFRVIRGDGAFISSGRGDLERIAWLPTSKRNVDWDSI